MKKYSMQGAIVFLGLCMVCSAWLFQSQPAPLPGPEPTPIVVVETWMVELTDAFKAEDNPLRVTQLRNLWSGIAALVPPEATSIINIERQNLLAGSITVQGLGPNNPAAGAIIKKQFAELLKKISDPLDDSERGVVSAYFDALADAAGDAL